MANDNTFYLAHNFVLKWEGGLCEDKYDAGGITNYGVSLRFLQNIDPTATRDDIINMTKERGKELFHEHFWNRCKCYEMPNKIAFAMYDTAVNVGCKQAVKFLQRALSDPAVQVDGLIGPITLNATRKYYASDIVRNLLIEREEFYKNLAKNKPTQKVFLKGWLNRVNSLRSALNNIK